MGCTIAARSVQKNVSSATRPSVLPCFRILRVLAKGASESLHATRQTIRPHRRRSFTLVESSRSSLHNLGHFHSPFPVSDIYLILFFHDRRLRVLFDSASAPVYVPHSTVQHSTRSHPFSVSIRFLRLCWSPPLVDPDGLRDHLNRVGLGSSLSCCCCSASIRLSISIYYPVGAWIYFITYQCIVPGCSTTIYGHWLDWLSPPPLSPSLPLSASQHHGISASHHTSAHRHCYCRVSPPVFFW